ncbi:MAG: OmpA family protein [Nitrosomonas sp.]
MIDTKSTTVQVCLGKAIHIGNLRFYQLAVHMRDTMKTTTIIFMTVLMLCEIVKTLSAGERKVWDENEITETDVVDALAPEEKIRTRSFKYIDIEHINTDLNTLSLEPVSLPVRITFDINSANLTSNAKGALDKIGNALKTDRLVEYSFIIEGHADRSGSFKLNQNLSQARANSVLRYLINQHGINQNRLKSVGKGYSELLNEKNPRAPENRRVTFVRQDSQFNQ